MIVNKRLPTILGLILLTVAIGSIVAAFEFGSKVITYADPQTTPREVRITNVSDTSVSISWLTAKKTSGGVLYTISTGQHIVSDDRTQLNDSFVSETHHVTLRNLSPLTTYSFYILSNGKKFDDQGKPFIFTTGPTISDSPPQYEPAYGKIVDINGQPSQEAIIYLTLGQSSELSTTVKLSGEWLIALSKARTKDARAYYSAEANDEQIIIVRAGMGKEARAITNMDNDSPVPTMVIGKTYNFTMEKDSQLVKTEDQAVLGAQPTPVKISPADKIAEKISILLPEDGGSLTTTKPLFRGTGIPGKTVFITVESVVQKGEVVISSDGTWFWSPPENLEPGEHTITIQTTDEQGRQVAKTHRFLVHKSGTQVLGEATPSATLTPTAAPEFTPTPTETVPQPTPTISDQPPVAGVFTPTLLILVTGIVIFFFGLLRFVYPLS